MEVEKVVTEKKELYAHLFDFIDSEGDSYSEFDSLISTLKDQNILNNKKDSISIIILLTKVFDNHQRTPSFIFKIFKVFQYIIQNNQTISNKEIFDICKQNKYLLLHLFDQKVIKPEESIITSLLKEKDFYFLYGQIKSYIDKQIAQRIENKISEICNDSIEFFEKKCKIGENDSYICTLIRSDSVEDFISLVTRKNISPSSKITNSIFETNPFLMDKQPTLMEYAAFFGSIEIFQYLFMNNATLTPSLWLYVVHGRNPDMIHFLEDNNVQPNDDVFENCIIESVKCHHNDISDYIISNLFKYTRYGYEDNITGNLASFVAEYHNYNYYPNDMNVFFENKYFSKTFMISQICPEFKTITIPSSITSIGKYAFSGCSKLEKVLIPSSIKLIDDYAFNGCSSIKEIVIPSSVSNIGNFAFKGCLSIKEISIPSSVIYIGFGAFDSESLKITIQSKYPSFCLNGLKNTKILEIIGNMNIIHEGFFSDCTSVEQLILPTTITSIEKYAFKNCESLKQMPIPSSSTKIAIGTFSGCLSLTEIEIPSSVKNIEECAFINCRSLQHVIIPTSVVSIGHSSFLNCSSLKQIKIPSSTISIGYSCFHGCQKLESIELLPPIEEIKSNMFYNCSSLKQIKIPDSVTRIGPSSFEGCLSLKIIEIPSSVKYIDMKAFYKCTSLTDIIFNKCPIKKIEANTFGMCSSLRKVVLPSTVKSIDFDAFAHCTSLNKILFPSSIEEINKNAFK